MELDEVIEAVFDGVMKGFPKKIPRVMSIVGGDDRVRVAVIDRVREKTGSKIEESSNGVYSVSLPYIIEKYDSRFC